MTPLEKPIQRLTRGGLPDNYGPDKGKRLVASLDLGDVLTLRPHRTRRPESVSLFDVYAWALRRRLQVEKLRRGRLSS